MHSSTTGGLRSRKTPDLLQVVGLNKRFTTFSLFHGRETTNALRDVSLAVAPGSCIGIVGESGSGKTTLVRCILGLETPTSGEIWFEGQRIDGRHRTPLHRGQIQPVFQNPMSSLNPHRRISAIVAEPLVVHSKLSAGECKVEVQRLLELVGLPAEFAERYPSQLSGGQCQRVSIARALALKPKLIVADEATSALDVLVQEQIVKLLMRLRADFGMAMLFVSHNVAVTRRISDGIAVMHKGSVVEFGSAEAIIKHPTHPYTKRLIASVPTLQRRRDINQAITKP